MRALSARAVREGGGVMNRLGLSETQPEKRVVVEVGSIDGALAVARAGADLLVTSAPYLAPPRDVQVRIEPDA